MNLSAPIRIGLRYSNSRKSNHFIAFINSFSIAGIALGLMAMIITSSVMNGFEGQLKDRILGLAAHFVVNDTIEPDIQQQLSPWISGTASFAEVEAVIQGKSGLKPLFLQGIDGNTVADLNRFQSNMMVGSLSTLNEKKYQIVVGRLLALRLDLSVGDEVRVILAGSSVYTPLGRMPAQRKFTVAGMFDIGSELDDKVALISLRDLARLQRISLEKASNTRLFMNDPFEFGAVRKILDEAGLEYTDWRERQGALFDAVKMEKNMMLLMLTLIVAVAAFNIVSALVMVVNEKQADIAILRTQGMCQNDIMKIFLVNGMSNGLKGTLIGAVLGLFITYQINNIIQGLNLPVVNFLPEGTLPVIVDHQQIAMLIGFSIFLCVLASLFPAWRALKVDPAAALRYE